MTKTLGFIGLGHLGFALARKLLRAGFAVTGYSKHSMDAFIAEGGVAAASAADVAGDVDIVFHCLPSVAALDDVVHGTSGTLKTLRQGATVIELSTYPLDRKVRLAESLRAAGVGLLDCEVSGTPVMAAEGRILLLVSGDRALADRMAPILKELAPAHYYLGPLGTSLKMKLVNNMLVAVHMMGAAEAIRMGIKAGIDPDTVVEILTKGASSSTVLGERGARVAARDYAGSTGSLDAFSKYLDMGSNLSKLLDAPTPMFHTALGYFRMALDQGFGPEDFSVVSETLERPDPGSIQVRSSA
ncbi:MAG: NAD(P)-dependent oxidoreductase [Betaproteobacteria bacterium]|nr:NAD(P)-dependent oxidoreductase [Betaproteobacteria bacterium]